MQDQRDAKRRDSGTFTCQMVAPLLLLPCHRASTGRSLEAETYAIQHAWSAVQLVASEHSSGAKHRKWQKHTQTHVCSKLPHTAYLWVWAAALLSLPHLHQSLNIEWGEDEERFLRRCGTGVCAYGACFINLLNSCQVTPIFLSQRKCVASRSRRKSLKKISFLSYLFTSPLAHTILAFFICLIGADIQDSSMCAVFFICCQRGRQGRGLASRSNITPAVWCMVLANKLFAQYGNNKINK